MPLLIGLLGFAVAQAATENPRDEGPAPYGVRCVQGKIGLSGPGAAQGVPGACLLSSFGDRAAAERFARTNFGGPGAACRCP